MEYQAIHPFWQPKHRGSGRSCIRHPGEVMDYKFSGLHAENLTPNQSLLRSLIFIDLKYLQGLDSRENLLFLYKSSFSYLLSIFIALRDTLVPYLLALAVRKVYIRRRCPAPLERPMGLACSHTASNYKYALYRPYSENFGSHHL